MWLYGTKISHTLQQTNKQRLNQSTHLLRRLEDNSVLRLVGEGNTKLKQSAKDIGEVLEEKLVVLGIELNVLLELLVLDKRQVGRHHHQRLGRLVRELRGSVPLLLLPLLAQQEFEELIGEDGWAEVPGAIEAGAVRVRTSEGVSADQSDDFSVVES